MLIFSSAVRSRLHSSIVASGLGEFIADAVRVQAERDIRLRVITLFVSIPHLAYDSEVSYTEEAIEQAIDNDPFTMPLPRRGEPMPTQYFLIEECVNALMDSVRLYINNPDEYFRRLFVSTREMLGENLPVGEVVHPITMRLIRP